MEKKERKYGKENSEKEEIRGRGKEKKEERRIPILSNALHLIFLSLVRGLSASSAEHLPARRQSAFYILPEMLVLIFLSVISPSVCTVSQSVGQCVYE
jgi:hypothetical protein